MVGSALRSFGANRSLTVASLFALLLLLGCPGTGVQEGDRSKENRVDAWREFWSAIGYGVVPEIPTADLPRADRAAKALASETPTTWRARFAQAQLSFLRGDFVTARAALGAARAACGADTGCQSASKTLWFAAVVDQHTTLDRVMYFDSLVSKEPEMDIDAIDIEAKNALSTVPTDLSDAARAWYLAGKSRIVRAHIMAARWSDNLVPGFEEQAATQVRMSLGLRDTPVERLLSYILRPTLPVPDLESPLKEVAAFWAANEILGPSGGALALDTHLIGRAPDALTWWQLARESPLVRSTSDADAQQAAALLRDIPVPPGSLLGAWRDIVLAFGESRSAGAGGCGRRTTRAAEEADGALHPLLHAVGRMHDGYDHLLCDRTAEAISSFDQARQAMERAGGWGRQVTLLRAVLRLGQRALFFDARYAQAHRLLRAGADWAAQSQFIDLALQSTSDLVQVVEELSLTGETLREASHAQANIDVAIKTYERLIQSPPSRTTGVFAEMLKSGSGIEPVRAGLYVSEARTLAELGAPWSRIQEKLHTAGGKGINPQALADLTVIMKFTQLLAQGETEQAFSVASAAPGTKQSLAFLQATQRGDKRALPALRNELADREKQLQRATSRTDLSALRKHLDTLLARQALAAARERYIVACEAVGDGAEATATFTAWKADPSSRAVADARPWQAAIMEGRVLSAQRDHRRALDAFRRAIAGLQQVAAGGHQAELRRDVARAQTDAYGGAARAAIRLGGGENVELAVELVDELRWTAGLHDLGRRSGCEPPPFALEAVAREHGDDVKVIFLSGVGIPRVMMAWLWSPATGLIQRELRFGEKERDLGASIQHVVYASERPSGALKQLLDWLGSKLKKGDPLVFAVPAFARAAGIHLLPIAGEPIALRHPFSYAPSIRAYQEIAARLVRGADRIVVGLPVTADATRAYIGEVTPLAKEVELRGIGAERLLWDKDATVAAATTALASARRVHISAHGMVDRLHPDQTGIYLSDGVLGVGATRQLSLPGSLVVLSACESGVWNHPFASGVPSLDLALLAAGARAVVSTPRPVRATVAATWMRQFHAAVDAGDTAVSAAWRAYRAAHERHAEDRDWGAFSVVGAGGRVFARP